MWFNLGAKLQKLQDIWKLFCKTRYNHFATFQLNPRLQEVWTFQSRKSAINGAEGKGTQRKL